MSGMETMRAMIELGLTDEQKLVLLAAIEKDAGPSRSTSAERQRRYRERWKEGSVTSVTSPVTQRCDVTPSPNEETSNPLLSEPNGSSEGVNARARQAAFPKPEWADPQHWTDFLANRRRKGRTNSPTAYKRFTDDIARLSDDEWPPGRLLEHAAAEGWAGIYDPREK